MKQCYGNLTKHHKYCPDFKDFFFIHIETPSFYTATPNQNENAKTMAPSNFDAEAFGDMFSTLYNQI